MSWKAEAECTVSCSVQDFYCGVDVWLERPQVVNRRLLGCVTVHKRQLDQDTSRTLSLHSSDDQHQSLSEESLRVLDHLVRCVCEEVEGTCHGDVIVRRLLPRMKRMEEGLEVVVIGEGVRVWSKV